MAADMLPLSNSHENTPCVEHTASCGYRTASDEPSRIVAVGTYHLFLLLVEGCCQIGSHGLFLVQRSIALSIHPVGPT